jgi:hypothetical protein
MTSRNERAKHKTKEFRVSSLDNGLTDRVAFKGLEHVLIEGIILYAECLKSGHVLASYTD